MGITGQTAPLVDAIQMAVHILFDKIMVLNSE